MIKKLDEISTLPEELYKSVSSVIETITFLSVEKPEDVKNKPAESEEYTNGSVLIKTADSTYLIEVLVPHGFLETISAELTIAATGKKEINEIIADVHLELVNNMAGSLMRKTESLTGTFTLEIPEYAVGKLSNDKAFTKHRYIVDSKYWISVAITKI